MQKIISLFQRDHEGTHLVYDEITPGAEWIVAGEGRATRKWDGTACLVKDGKLHKRYDCKPGRTPPEGFEPCQPEPDEQSGHWPGWVPVTDDPNDKWHREAFCPAYQDGTYELCGPKVQGNPERIGRHILIQHGGEILFGVPRDFGGLQTWFEEHDVEGIVWHHPDGRMVKIKGKDFGVRRA